MSADNPETTRQAEPNHDSAADSPLAPVPARAANPRFHDLDALRASAMLLGIVLHAVLFFMPGAWGGGGEEYPEEVSGVYTLAFFAIHGFRMQVFFLLSGFFTAMLWQRRGLQELVMHRLKRIGLPLAIGAVTVIPVTTWAFLWALPSDDEFQLWWWPLIWLTTFTHLWFLWFLLWLGAGFAALAKLGVKFDHPVIWWLAIPLTVAPQLLMDEPVFGPDTSDGLIPSPIVIGYYALFFAFGAFFYRRGIRARPWWSAALPPALTFLYEVKAEWAAPAAAALQAGYAWLMCFGLMGLFSWVAAKERFWVRYVSDASYWLYLWHLPLIVVEYKLIRDLPISPHIKFALMCAATTAILLVAYQLGVRYTPIGTMLNGKRTRRGTVSTTNV